MKNQRGNAFLVLILAVAAIAGIYGWIANIVKLVGLLGGDINAMFIARIVGIFAAPLGSILGYC